MQILKATPINLHHLRYLVATCDQGSFRKAARLLNVDGSSVSRRVRELEEHLGIILVTRTRFGTYPTVDGVRLALSAAKLLSLLGKDTTASGGSIKAEAEIAAFAKNAFAMYLRKKCTEFI